MKKLALLIVAALALGGCFTAPVPDTDHAPFCTLIDEGIVVC